MMVRADLSSAAYDLGLRTDRGIRSENQDSVSIVWSSKGRVHTHTGSGSSESDILFMGDLVVLTVCDGMGGMVDGAAASSSVVDGIIDWISSYDGTGDPVQSLVDRIHVLEAQVMEHYPGSGTTLSVALMADGAWTSIHLGDSRCYASYGDHVWRTKDHSPVEDLFQKGYIDEDDMNDHMLSNVVSSYIGGGHSDDIVVQPVPDGWDSLVLCSDGAFGYMSPGDFHELIRSVDGPDGIVDTALSGGSRDNVTVVMVRPVCHTSTIADGRMA